MVFILGKKVIRELFDRSLRCDRAGSEKAVSDEFPPGAPWASTSSLTRESPWSSPGESSLIL